MSYVCIYVSMSMFLMKFICELETRAIRLEQDQQQSLDLDIVGECKVPARENGFSLSLHYNTDLNIFMNCWPQVLQGSFILQEALTIIQVAGSSLGLASIGIQCGSYYVVLSHRGGHLLHYWVIQEIRGGFPQFP